MFRNNIKLKTFASLASIITFLFFHFPFYEFVFNNVAYDSFNGLILIVSLMVLMFVLNFLVFYLVFFLSRRAGKLLLALFFILNAVSLYFVNTYNVIIDETMIG